MSNPLIEKPQEDSKVLTGAGPFDSAEDLFRSTTIGVFNEGKQLDISTLLIDAGAMALDVVGFMADPLGTLASSVVGWIIENVGFVRKPFDDLAGDPPAIEAVANTWQNISDRLKEEHQTYKDSATKLAGWSGMAADAYAQRCNGLASKLEAASDAAGALSKEIQLAGVCVAATRALIRDLLAELAGTLIAWGIPAAAAAIPSAGASIAAFITRAVTKAVSIGAKIMKFLSKLFKALDKLGSLAKRGGDALRKQADELADLSKSMPNSRYGNQRAAELSHSSTTRTSQADTLDRVGDNLGNAGTRAREGMENAATKMDDWAQRTSQKVDDWAQGVKDNAANRKQAVKDFFERNNFPPLSTKERDIADPTKGWQRKGDAIDSHSGKGLLDGQNWVRAVASKDISHLMPQFGDLISPIKEFGKEYNKAFWTNDDQKWEEKPRSW